MDEKASPAGKDKGKHQYGTLRDTREGFLHELAGKGIVPVLWENGAGVIYGVTI